MLRFFAIALALSFGFKAGADFQVPALTAPVMDTAGMLSSSTVAQLNPFLQQIFQNGGSQIEILTVKDLGGLSIEEASIQVTDRWKLGKRKEDRGLLILIASAEHKIRIEVGQGLEGEIPDAVANRIVHDVMIPRLREGSADNAVIDGVSAVLHYSDPKLLESAQDGGLRSQATTHKRSFGRFGTLIFWLLILLIFLRPRGGGGMGGLITYGLFGGLGGGGGYGGGGGGSGGGGWSGGGGGFSGGGASGGW